MKFAPIFAALTILAGAGSLQAQVLTFDLGSLAQLVLMKAVGDNQLTTLAQTLGINTQQLATANSIYATLGSPASSNLPAFNIQDLQPVLNQIPGLNGVNVSNLFPPGVGSAFLGNTFSQWQTSFGTPSNLYSDQARFQAVGTVGGNTANGVDQSAYMTYLANSSGTAGSNRGAVALALSRILTSGLMSLVSSQAQQTAAAAAQRQQFSDQAQMNLTLTDRAKLTNNQGVLSIDLQLQQLQQQSAANAAHASQLDAQSALLQEQVEREEVDRANRD